jgi:hypothetical protein
VGLADLAPFVSVVDTLAAERHPGYAVATSSHQQVVALATGR